MIVRNGCKELFSAVVAGYDYIHDESSNREKVYEDIRISLLFWRGRV
jgi:hypothetical protein